MDKIVGEREERLKRNVAGMNKNLSRDFEWPAGFGARNVSTIPTMINTSLTVQSASTSSKPKSQSVSMENITSCDKTVIERSSKSMKQKSCYSINSSKKSSTSMDLQKKRLAIQTEKEKQSLERMKEDLEKKRKEVENRMKILQMEHELKEAEIEEEGNSESASQISRKECSQSGNDNKMKSSVVEWINNVEPFEPSDDEVFPEAKRNCRDEIQMLCQTLTNVIKTVAPARQDTLLSRYIVDKDFPVFDENPENWPLFYQRFLQISQMCDYRADEILVKLQKCLRGDAKSAVAGLLLSPNNTDLIMDTLKRRFGRPEYIIEAMIIKIKNISQIRDNNIEKLIHFSNEVCNLVATMESLVSSDYLRNPQLQKDLLAKLPDMMKLRWGEFMVKNMGNASLKDFAAWIGEMAEAACYVSSPQVSSSYPDKFNPKRPYFQRRNETVLNTKEIDKKSTYGRESTCSYCEKKHIEKVCPQITSVDLETRWKIITAKKLCFSCLQKGHHRFKCKNKQECGTDGCKFYHHPLLHKARSSQNLAEVEQACLPVAESELVCAVKHQTKQILLRMLPVLVHGPRGVLKVLALCDEASTVTLIDESIAKKLGIHGEKDPLCIQWTNGQTACLDQSEKLDFKISGLQNSMKFALKNVRTVDSLLLPEQFINMEAWEMYEYLRGLPIENIDNERPMLLLGQDNASLIVPRQIRNGPETCPIATKCQLGWSLHGPTPRKTEDSEVYTLHICNINESENDLHELVKQSFSTEAFGVSIKPPKPSRDDMRAMEMMKSTANRVGPRYEIGLLWKLDDFKFPESKPTAFQRLRCVERKLQKNRRLAEEYCKKIHSYVEKGYAKKLTPLEAAIETSRTWYLPHFPVENPMKPGKIRLVFDATAKCNGSSSNDFLLSGPDLLQPLVSVLWKFRQRKYGICGDVREMFHQVMVRKSDREAQRFLWRDLDDTKTPDTYEMQVMTFGATCSPVCAQFIKNLNAQEQASSENILKAITQKFYVDDYLDSVDTDEEAVYMIKEVCRVLDLGGFEIVNWVSNSTAVRRALPETLLEAKMIDGDKGTTQRVLGIWWDSKNDNICCVRVHARRCEQCSARASDVMIGVFRELDFKSNVLVHLVLKFDVRI